jgi:hypothetical protein
MVFVIVIGGCMLDDEGSTEKEVRLKTPSGFVTLKFRQDYFLYDSDRRGDWMATLDIYYPEMHPAVPLNSRKSTLVQVIVDRKDPVASFKSHINSSSYDENKPGANFKAGEDGIYEIFSRVKPPFVPKSSGTYYVFKGSDGQNVLVLGSTDGKYSFRRKINDELTVQYLVPKNQVNDFYETDTAVSEFLSQHIEKP